MPSTPIIQDDILTEQILQAALQLYQKHGLKKVTMDDVSKVIGKSRSSLYYYYKNRDEIFDAVMEALIREVIDEIAEAIDKAKTAEDKIRAFCLAKIKTSEEKKSFFTAIETGMNADEISKHAQTISEVHKRLMQQESILIKKVLSAGMKNKDIRLVKPKEQDIFIFILLSSVRGIKREMAHYNDFSKINFAIDTLASMMMKWLEQ